MASQKCLDQIAALQPPNNVACSSDWCYKTSFVRNQHCQGNNFPMDYPMVGVEFDNDGNATVCNCCCSCFTLDTPIEVQHGEFKMIQDIQGGDKILAAGVDLEWKPVTVAYRNGSLEKSLIPGLFYVAYKLEGEKEARHLVVTPDHLFLMYSTKSLKKVQHLVPGNKLIDKKGQPAIVQFVVTGHHETTVQSIQMEGELDPDNLDGHLLNSNGVVTADYLLQVSYEMGSVKKDFSFSFDKENKIKEVGTEEYGAQFLSKERDLFIDDEKKWPKGFMPDRKRLVNIPKNARPFFTDMQCQDLLNNVELNSYTTVVGRADIEWLFNMGDMLFQDITYILDWHNKVPNAYSWNQGRQKFILITGGLVRMKELFLEGHALILGSMQAFLSGKATVGEADYEASSNIIRKVFPHSLCPTIFIEGLKQLRKIFSAIAPENAEGDNSNIALIPSLKGRLEAFQNAFSFLGLPDSVRVKNKFYGIEKAFASIDNSSVTVVFDEPVEIKTATNINNYLITPNAKIENAELDKSSSHRIILKVVGLESSQKYILSVNNVVSVDGGNLSVTGDAVIFKSV